MLAQHGINPSHDQIYLRCLLHLGADRRSGGTLYDKFEALLAQMGIQLEINTEQNEIQDITRSVDATTRHSAELQTQSQAGSDSGIQSRRASFHSLANERGETSTIARVRSFSRPPIADLQGDQGAKAGHRPSTRASTRPSERIERQESARQPAVQPARGRLTATEFASNLQHVQRRNVSASASRTRTRPGHNVLPRHLRTRSDQHPQTQQRETLSLAGDEYQEFTPELEQYEDADDTRNRSPGNHGHAYQVDGRELLYRPTGTQLLRDADSFQDFRIRALTRKALSRWRIVALYSLEQHERMRQSALSFDLGILLRQSFDQWRGTFQSRMQAAANVRYFEQLERRAHRARDLYLLMKAFTHWQQITNEKIKHTLQARRYVLSVKYFNAWLELTVVNHRKVQLQGQRKFYNVWNQRSLTSIKTNDMASLARRRNLTKTAYWKWFWAFCERRAPQWKERRLQTTTINRWSFASRRNLYREYEVTVRRNGSLKKAFFFKWIEQARSALLNTSKADEFRDQKITARSMLAYQRAIKYAPLTRQISNMADWRIAGSTFAILVSRVRTEQQAKKVDELRVLRNAWTVWNDSLRWQTLEARIDDRILVQALYRWVLAERCVLLQRLCEQRSVQLCLARLVEGYRGRVTIRRAICHDFEKKRRTRAAKLTINRWRQSVNNCNENARVAVVFEAPRIAQEAILSWTEKMSHIRKIDKWAVDASYYFRSVRFLRHWRAATAEARRRRYREAYVQIRRLNKMKLASSCLQIWRDRTQAIVHMQEEAQSNDHRQLLQHGISLFDHWRTRLAFLVNRQGQTVFEFDRRFAHNQLDNWITRHRTQVQFQELARVNAELRISNVAFGWLHKLHLRVIELKGRENNAESLRRWYAKRHLHNRIRQWREGLAKRIAEKQDQPLRPPVSSAKTQRRGLGPDAEEDEAAGPAEDWTAFEKDFDLGDWIPALEVGASSTPLPGYLSTPSKRAARARVIMARMSTTPAGTPFSTRARAQLGREPGTARKSQLGRSTAGFNGSAFRPIQEASPKTPEKS